MRCLRNGLSCRGHRTSLRSWKSHKAQEGQVQDAAPRSGQAALLYTSGNGQMESSPVDMGLEWLVGEKLNVSWPCALSAQGANSNLGCRKQSVTSRSKEEVVPVSSALMRPHLGYCIPLWGPRQEGDRQLLEWGQRKATKTITGDGASFLQRQAERAGFVQP